MQNELEARLTVCCGRSGSGKTTFAFRYLLNAEDSACNFIFDDRGQAAARLNLTPARTALECEKALATRWVCFDPHLAFPGRLEDAFKWFCQWVYDVSKRGDGHKIILVDEVWRFCTPNAIPQELANIVQTGRCHGLELLCCTQRPNRLNGAITNETTELVCFSLLPGLALDKVGELGANIDAVSALPKGQFISYNLDSDESLTGALW